MIRSSLLNVTVVFGNSWMLSGSYLNLRRVVTFSSGAKRVLMLQSRDGCGAEEISARYELNTVVIFVFVEVPGDVDVVRAPAVPDIDSPSCGLLLLLKEESSVRSCQINYQKPKGRVGDLKTFHSPYSAFKCHYTAFQINSIRSISSQYWNRHENRGSDNTVTYQHYSRYFNNLPKK